MAAARDQAARVLRPEPDAAEDAFARDRSEATAEQSRAHPSEEVVARRPAEAPGNPATSTPNAPAAARLGKGRRSRQGRSGLRPTPLGSGPASTSTASRR